MSQQPVAYLYPEFLESAEGRPIRILSEYLEPLKRLKEQKIQDTASFTKPLSFPEGMPYVIVNGVVAVEEGRSTGAKAGRVLRLNAKAAN